MLLEFTSVHTLCAAQKDRLIYALKGGIAHTPEATKGYVMFEGLCLKTTEIAGLRHQPQILREVK